MCGEAGSKEKQAEEAGVELSFPGTPPPIQRPTSFTFHVSIASPWSIHVFVPIDELNQGFSQKCPPRHSQNSALLI